jgi:hypothetical protein
MTPLIKTLAAVVAGTVLATSAFAQNAREIRGASPFESGRPQRISTSQASAHNHRRPALVVGGCE